MNINKDGSTGIRYVNETENNDYMIISNISEDYPAYNSGIQQGDTLIKINGISTTDINSIRKGLSNKEIGQKVVYTSPQRISY